MVHIGDKIVEYLDGGINELEMNSKNMNKIDW